MGLPNEAVRMSVLDVLTGISELATEAQRHREEVIRKKTEEKRVLRFAQDDHETLLHFDF
jgi:hypothetical protein